MCFNVIIGSNNLIPEQEYSQEQQYSQQQYSQQQYPQQQYSQQQYSQQQYPEYIAQLNNKINVKKQDPLDPSVKHSYIYNKYFKDYQDATPTAPEVKIPKTKEEYFQLLNEERIRRIQEAHRISQIKSKKLLFTTNNAYHGNNVKATTNKLQKMSFY